MVGDWLIALLLPLPARAAIDSSRDHSLSSLQLAFISCCTYYYCYYHFFIIITIIIITIIPLIIMLWLPRQLTRSSKLIFAKTLQYYNPLDYN